MDPENQGFIPNSWGKRPRTTNCKLKAPLRVFRLCLLAICLPCLLVAGPLYLRYRVYSEQLVPLGMSDMRVLDHRISTTWCQKQIVSSNATFNAFLLAQKPPIHHEPKYVTMVREIVLEDDMKEYWGFYLLKGSKVTVSTCCRRPGASLIVIRGHHHLRHCAYIGDDSSEEQDEIDEIEETKRGENSSFSIQKEMQRARPGVTFHGNDTNLFEGNLLSKELNHLDDEELDFSALQKHNEKIKHPVKAVGHVSRLHHTSHEQNLRKYENERDDSRASAEVLRAAVKKLKAYQADGVDVMKKLRKTMGLGSKEKDNLSWMKKLFEELPQKQNRTSRSADILQAIKLELNSHDELYDNAEEEGVEHQEVRGRINGTTANDTSNSEFWSSFSSSEERLLECDGLILSQPLVPSPLCRRGQSEEDLERACKQQQFSYKVPGNGYYFFVFSSENEVQPNYLRAKFQLEKLVYNVTNPVAVCENSTGQCAMPLNFFSSQKLVLELPVNDSLWNTEFIVTSTCEPRTFLYAACIIAVPILILMCAF